MKRLSICACAATLSFVIFLMAFWLPQGREKVFAATSDFLWWYAISCLSVLAIDAGVGIFVHGGMATRITALPACLWSGYALWLFGCFLFHQDRIMFEAAASIGAAFLVARSLFHRFFSDWRDFLKCSRKRGAHPDDSARGWAYYVICCVTGLVTFVTLFKLLG
jgi:hypothetical protein